MINEKMYGLGSKRSSIREIFEYAKSRAARGSLLPRERKHAALFHSCGVAFGKGDNTLRCAVVDAPPDGYLRCDLPRKVDAL